MPRVLYVSSEIAPFLSTSFVAELVSKLAVDMQKRGIELRILVPRFGIISERKHRIHVVVRLSGISIVIGSQAHALAVKSASIPKVRCQVYFLDNDDFFCRKAVFTDEKNNFFKDNGDRLIFFCQGVLETIKRLGWAPDVVHCHDWMTCLVPFYLKTAYKSDPIFSRTKVLYTAYNNVFAGSLGDNFAERARLEGIGEDSLEGLATADFQGLMQAGLQHSDMVVRAEELDKSPLQKLLPEGSKLIAGDEPGIEAYYELYHQLTGVR